MIVLEVEVERLSKMKTKAKGGAKQHQVRSEFGRAKRR